MSISWSIFDVIGPVMIGPSSSHTAGACRIGYMAQAIYGKFKHIDIYLHGSFAEVYEGHCTDVALLAGALKMESHNKELPNSFELAKRLGVTFNFIVTDLGEGFHPNTAKFIFDNNAEKSILGSSIGGGKALIKQIGKIPLSISLEYSTLIIHFEHSKIKPQDIIEIINSTSKTIVNIATGQYKEFSIMTIEVKEWFSPDDLTKFEELNGVGWAKFVNHLPNFVNLES
jgi:L-serine dehydratase